MHVTRPIAVLALLSFLCHGSAAGEEPIAPPQKREWMVRHQEEDGSWDPVRFTAHCDKTGPCGGAGISGDRAGTTGLVLLCFTGYGETDKTPMYGDVVRKAVQWFRKVQDERGAFEAPGGGRFLLNHARATAGLTAQFASSKDTLVQSSAQRAVDFLLAKRLKEGGWPAAAEGTTTDLETSTWAAMALQAAKSSGLEVGKEPFGAYLAWLDAGTDAETGRFGPEPKAAAEGRPVSETATAMALVSRWMLGAKPEDPPIVKGLGLLARRHPMGGEMGADLDFTYAYFGTHAFHLANPVPYSKRSAKFKDWTGSLKKAVIDEQHMDKALCNWGSWSPSIPSAQEGRITCTALAVLVLLDYYR